MSLGGCRCGKSHLDIHSLELLYQLSLNENFTINYSKLETYKNERGAFFHNAIMNWIKQEEKVKVEKLSPHQIDALEGREGIIMGKKPTQTESFSLCGCNFHSIPGCIGMLPQGYTLNISGNPQLKGIPNLIYQMPNISSLALNRYSIKKLPEDIGKFKKLHYLSLADNELEGLPYNIPELKEINKLDISNNNVKALPESIGELTNLQEFNCRINHLSSIPKSCNNFLDSMIIYAEGNTISDWSHLDHCISLKEFNDISKIEQSSALLNARKHGFCNARAFNI